MGWEIYINIFYMEWGYQHRCGCWDEQGFAVLDPLSSYHVARRELLAEGWDALEGVDSLSLFQGEDSQCLRNSKGSPRLPVHTHKGKHHCLEIPTVLESAGIRCI